LLALNTASGVYKFLLLLHILSVVVGIGAVMLNGLYAAQSQKRPGPTGRAVSEANFAISGIAEKVIYLIPLWGILLVLASGDQWRFSQTWVWLSILVYIAALGVAHGVLNPGHRRINELLAEMENTPPPAGGAPPQVAEIQTIGQRQAMAGMFNNLAVVVLIALMVWKPGFPG
jgi:uncharacterized membrane protein